MTVKLKKSALRKDCFVIRKYPHLIETKPKHIKEYVYQKGRLVAKEKEKEK